MYWADEIADSIIKKKPNKDEYVCAAGISPSGSVHIGNFRDIATSYFVVKALRSKGKKARLLFSWDEFDRLRKVPVNVAKVDDKFEENIGKPYVDVKDPFGEKASYAQRFEEEFENSVKPFGIDLDFRHQAEMYRSGKYTKYILLALQKRKEIFDILASHRTQAVQEGERDNYYPVQIYCSSCGKDTTKITSLSDDCTKGTYTCACGHSSSYDFTTEFNCKLAWKVDWPMRWAYEGVDFEPGGKDHASPHGSYDTSKDISRAIFGYEPPMFKGYEFIGIKGTTGKMSGSSGLNLTPDTLLKIYQPEVILWLYAKTDPVKAFDFCFDDGILRQYFEFDKMLDDVRNGKANEVVTRVMEMCSIEGRDVRTVPMSLLVQLGSVVNFNVEMLELVFKNIEQNYTYEDFKDRLERAKYWLKECSPENVNTLRKTRNFAHFDTLDDASKEEIKQLFDYIKKGGYTLNELQTEIYAIPLRVRGLDRDTKEAKNAQGAFFKNVYTVLIDKEKGPRLYLFLFAIDPKQYVNLLDFSYPETEEEKELNKQMQVSNEVEVEPVVEEVKEADPVQEVKPQIVLDDFSKIDLRVCKIVKAQEIRKSQYCLKITLFDGIGERVIVSSIKSYYKCEDLVGKKIIVVANLEPKRLAGVESNGMLLAGTNNACGCKVVFVDDSIPEGTRIC